MLINSYGTRRPTAGAYVSLDPGTGPADTSVLLQVNPPIYKTEQHLEQVVQDLGLTVVYIMQEIDPLLQTTLHRY